MDIDTAYSSMSIICHLSAHLSSFCTQWLIFCFSKLSALGWGRREEGGGRRGGL
jgi:hypothetical protein